jgi:DNA-directed RNA polymerase specialized sigma24 family protein
MPSTAAAASSRVRGRRRYGPPLACALALAVGVTIPARAAAPSLPAMLLGRLCAQTLRPNEEDRLYGLISITVRATLKYEGGKFSPDVIDDAVQDALGAVTAACPQMTAADRAQRLGMAVALIRAATIKRLQEPKARRPKTRRPKTRNDKAARATAADLSEELSSQEIDSWLDALPARERAAALFLYASDVTDKEIAAALGLSPRGLAARFRDARRELLQFYREDWNNPPPPPIPPPPADEFRGAGMPLAELLAAPAGSPATVRITGISGDIYAGWSLLATVSGLPAERGLALTGPILLAPDSPGHRRMLVTAVDEIGDPHDSPRRFLLKAFAIDGDGEGAGLHDTLHLAAAAVDNMPARRTLRRRDLAAIEIARCLWYDYHTAGNPGLCG